MGIQIIHIHTNLILNSNIRFLRIYTKVSDSLQSYLVMGQEHPTLNKAQLQSDLRQAKARIAIRRGQKINAINKKKKEIKAHLESGNEMMAMVHVRNEPEDKRELG